MRKKFRIFFEKSGFPGSEPDFRISAHGVAMGGPRASYSQNFIPLAALVPEIPSSLTIIKHRIKQLLVNLSSNAE